MIQSILSTSKTLLIAFFVLSSLSIFSQSNPGKMKLTPPQPAPLFTTKDINNTTVNLVDYKGKKVLLTFYRNVGCPICNFRFHELQEQAEFFKSKALVVLAVYESSPEKMKEYILDETFYATMIPNSNLSLYELYSIERSGGKMMKGMFYGAMGKMNKGKKLFKKKLKQDGNSNRISADFLVDENGNVQSAYYGKFVGDHLPIDDIKQFLK